MPFQPRHVYACAACVLAALASERACAQLRGSDAPALRGVEAPLPAEPNIPLSAGDDVQTQVDRPTSAVTTRGTRAATRQPVGRAVYTATSPDQLKPAARSPALQRPPVVEPVPEPALTAAQIARAAERARLLRAQDPYAPLGVDAGGLRLFPSIEAGAGYDSNPQRTAGGRGSTVYRTEAALRLESDWAVHALTGDLRGAYSVFPDVSGSNRPEGDARLGLRLDADRELRFDIETRGRIETQQPGAVTTPTDTANRPIVATYGVSTQATWSPGRWQGSLRGSIDRTSYGEAKLANGATLAQDDRDLMQYELRGRVGYEATPGVRPFIETRLDTRRYDESTLLTDGTGAPTGASLDRSSVGVGLLAGTSFEITRTLTGEVQGGYGLRRYDDRQLRALRGPLFDAALVWTASPLTTVTLRGAAGLGETTLAGSSGVSETRVGAEISHALRRNLVATATAGLARSDYRNVLLTEDTLTLGTRLDWRLTRSVVVRASFTHERLKTSGPGRDYTANAFLLGLRLQR